MIKRKIGSIDLEGKEIVAELCKEFNLNLNTLEIARRFLAQIELGNSVVQNNPNLRMVFISAPYMSMGLVYAFRKAQIDVVELQHGAIHTAHFGYIQYKKFNPLLFPTELWAWGAKVKEVFDSEYGMFSQKRVIPIGHYFLNELGKETITTSDEIVISVSLQDDSVGQKLVPWIIEVAILNPNIKFLLVRRNLPLSFYAEFSFPKNVEFSKQDVYRTILQSQIHCTVFSSCALEAPYLGVANILVDIEGKSKAYFKEQLGEKNTCYIINPEEFESSVKALLKVPKNELQESNSRNISTDFESNLKRALNNLDIVT